jgi:anaerobic magnesium-protoporphyrin IX monomethyl ester cyclase
LHIQLIHPPVYLNVHAMTALRPSLPLGLAYVAASLRKAGHEVSLLDAVAAAPDQVTRDRHLYRMGLTPAEIVERLDPKAQAFGVTNMWSFSWPLVRELLVRIKERFPETPLVCGGEHFTGLPEHSLRTAPIDYIVTGEGEDAAVALFDALERGTGVEHVPGLVFLRDGALMATTAAARKRDVDELPWPAWDLVDIEAYNEHGLVNGIRAGKTVPILATRGCPYQCTYCSSPGMWTTRYVTRDPEDVADEIAHYYRTFEARNFPFQDLTAIVKRDWVIAFCNALLERKLEGITWQFPSGTRCEVIDDEVARLLYLTGGRSLAYAPESGSERTRKLIKKKMKTESLIDAVKASVKNKLSITCFFVIGFPHDEASDLKDTARLVRRLALLGIDDIAIGFFFPIPNTELYRQLVERGEVPLQDQEKFDEFLLTPIYANEAKLTEEHNYCDHLSARQLTAWKYRLLLNFYGLSFLARPWRVVSVLLNTLRGKETRKLETYLVERRRKRKLEKREAPAGSPTQAA